MTTYTSILILLCISAINCSILNDVFGRDNVGLNALSRQEKCTATLQDGTQEEGICKTRTECLLTGGVPRGRCGLLSTCCAYSKGCGRTSNLKVSYFSSGLNSLPPESCTYNILQANENVCQIRLDFLGFQTNPPEMVTTTPPELQCTVDNFFVTPYKGLPQICGYNTGQHIYLHLPRYLKNITLNMKIGRRSNNLPNWNIKITQLECPRKGSIFTKVDKELVDDFNNLAPPTCLQYFTGNSGTFTNFGYDATRANNAFVSYQKYAICFKRTEEICGVNFRATYNFGNDCLNTYMEVPGLYNSAVNNNNRLCSTGNETQVTSTAPGPLHIDFYAGSNNGNSVGFNIAYEMRTCSS